MFLVSQEQRTLERDIVQKMLILTSKMNFRDLIGFLLMPNIAYQESSLSTNNSNLDFFHVDAVESHDLKIRT